MNKKAVKIAAAEGRGRGKKKTQAYGVGYLKG
jgi:hypothetical protein